ncbi:MAG: TMEM165/GDT1 family protein [Nannocystaceae bacterium]
MDLRLFLSTFGLVFLAELGDKTQLATAGLAAESGRRWLVFAASAAALVTSSLLAALAGAWLHSRVDAALITRVGGALFVVIGAWMIYASFRGAPG